jgi:hypothetical protein
MAKINLSSASVEAGHPLLAIIPCQGGALYNQVQVDIFDVGIRNPGLRLGFSFPPSAQNEGVFEVPVETGNLPVGIYQIVHVRFHGPRSQDVEWQLDVLPSSEQTRIVFEVRAAGTALRSENEVLEELIRREIELERSFNSAIDIRVSKSEKPTKVYSAFVFVRDVLIGTRIRFDQYELLPTRAGLDSEDGVNFVNEFMARHTAVGVHFEYDDQLRQRSQQSNPVCVVHFPNLVGNNFDEALSYCTNQTELLLLALALSRDSSGRIFEIVLVDRVEPSATKYSPSEHYVGNLLTGQLSGECADSLDAYLAGMRKNSLNQFLVELYKEARRERHYDFQYLRFWQILEVLADSRNYDSNLQLVDYEGEVMLDNGRPRLANNAPHAVFCLFRESGFGGTEATWKDVNIWFALRNAVAHHGAIAKFEQLSRESVREWARLGIKEIGQTPGHDPVLWRLKEDAKLLLMRRLTLGDRFCDTVETGSAFSPSTSRI